MNLLDFMILAALFFFILRGFFRGFFKELGSLAGVILGLLLADIYHPSLAGFLERFLSWGKLIPLLSFALLFAMVLVLCNLAGRSLKGAFQKVHLGWADKWLGAGLAALKGIAVVFLIFILVGFFVPSQTPAIARSTGAHLIIDSYRYILGFASQDSYQRWKEKMVAKKRETNDALSKKFGQQSR